MKKNRMMIIVAIFLWILFFTGDILNVMVNIYNFKYYSSILLFITTNK